jgi:hypothetical protein
MGVVNGLASPMGPSPEFGLTRWGRVIIINDPNFIVLQWFAVVERMFLPQNDATIERH